MSGELDQAIAGIQRLIPLVDELAKLGCAVQIMIEVDGHTVTLEAPRRSGELRYVSIADEVDEAER